MKVNTSIVGRFSRKDLLDLNQVYRKVFIQLFKYKVACGGGYL